MYKQKLKIKGWDFNWRLALMMFMQYMLLAVWWVPLAAYLGNGLKFSVFDTSLILSSIAIGSMASPIIGMIADRYFASEKVLAFLNFLTALLLLFAARQTNFLVLLVAVTLAMLCYMPTWSLTSAIAMAHAPAEQFPRIRVFGSIGWVASGVFSLIAINVFKVSIFDGTDLPFYCGASISLIAAVFNLFLPHTPHAEMKNEKVQILDVLGLRAFTMLKDKSFCMFMIFSFLSIIPFSLYHVYGSMFFADHSVTNITFMMNWGQFAEMFFLTITTSVILKAGIKWTLVIGLIAMLVRYVSFYMGVHFGMEWLYVIGILVHGLIFGLFYVGGQVYTDRNAPKELKAQAQGFLSFVVWGLGLLIGIQVNGFLIGYFRIGDLRDWNTIFLITSICSAIILILFGVFFRINTKHKMKA